MRLIEPWSRAARGNFRLQFKLVSHLRQSSGETGSGNTRAIRSKVPKIGINGVAEISRFCGMLDAALQAGPMYVRNREPSLDELLNDPVTRLVMARDGFSDEAVRTLIAEARQRLLARDDTHSQPAAAPA